jgi:hypothetical protein
VDSVTTEFRAPATWFAPAGWAASCRSPRRLDPDRHHRQRRNRAIPVGRPALRYFGDDGGVLTVTGSPARSLALSASVLLVLGGGLLLAVRRRIRRDTSR